MTPLVVTEHLQVSPEWSWVLVAWLFPLGPVAFVVWWLVSAIRFEVRRRAVVSPEPGYVAVEGTIADDRNRKVPAVAATFDLEVKKLKRGHGYRLRQHTVSVRPFTIETATGQRFEVQPARDTVALHAPLEGEHTSRVSRVGAGDRVWVYGPAAMIHVQKRNGSSKQAAAQSESGSGSETETETEREELGSAQADSSLLVATTPIAGVFRSERNRRAWLAAVAATFLVVAELLVFGGYWDVVRAGEPAVGQVVDKSMRLERERSRFGSSFLTTAFVVTVEVGERREAFDVSQQGWDRLELASPVALLSAPGTLMLGNEPYTTVGRCVVMSAVVFFGLFGFVIAALFQRPWYSVKRGWRGTDRPPVTKVAA